METGQASDSPAFGRSLETSLVEWKPVSSGVMVDMPYSLGNFLSGMETTNGTPKRPAIFVPWKLP